jgi:hypothetical protein
LAGRGAAADNRETVAMEKWSFLAFGRSYEITDYGPRFGIQVTRDGYTVWTGYRDGARLVTDTSTLPARELVALREELIPRALDGRKRRAPARSAPRPTDADGRARRARPAVEQLELLGARLRSGWQR